MDCDVERLDLPEPPEQPDHETQGHEYRVWYVLRELRAAVVEDGHEMAYRISEAACAIETGASAQVLRLSCDDRDEIRFALFAASRAACERFPAYIPRTHIRHGFRALAELAEIWAASDATRRELDGDILHNRNMARILRNDAHNIVLAADVAAKLSSQLTALSDITSAR